MQTQANSSTALLDNTGEATSPDSREILRGENLRKTFRSGAQDVTPLAGINLTIARGEMVAVVGPSGTGKSTLLHLLAALDTPTSGTVYFGGNSLQSFSETELAEYRNRAVGFVWQRHHLLPDFTAAENVAMPLLVRGVSLARALVNGPALLLADEPTGDLDQRSAENIFELMQRLHQSLQLTSILATHNLSLARRADRVLTLERGALAPGAEALSDSAVPLPRVASAGAMTPGDRG